jgi:hypothetical protein
MELALEILKLAKEKGSNTYSCRCSQQMLSNTANTKIVDVSRNP